MGTAVSCVFSYFRARTAIPVAFVVHSPSGTAMSGMSEHTYDWLEARHLAVWSDRVVGCWCCRVSLVVTSKAFNQEIRTKGKCVKGQSSDVVGADAKSRLIKASEPQLVGQSLDSSVRYDAHHRAYRYTLPDMRAALVHGITNA